MKSFNNYLFSLLAVAIGFTASSCFGGNQELVELKTAELCSINDQVTKQGIPGGLKDGESVEIKAAMRVERSPDKDPVIRDLKVESIKVTKTSDVVLDRIAIPVAGSGEVLKSDVVEVNQVVGTPSFRQEYLSVPIGN